MMAYCHQKPLQVVFRGLTVALEIYNCMNQCHPTKLNLKMKTNVVGQLKTLMQAQVGSFSHTILEKAPSALPGA